MWKSVVRRVVVMADVVYGLLTMNCFIHYYNQNYLDLEYYLAHKYVTTFKPL